MVGRFLQLPGSIPSHDTFGRVFGRLGTSEFYACLQRWVRTLNSVLTDHGVRLDSKTLRHSFDTASGKDALQLLNAWSSDLQVCLGQVQVRFTIEEAEEHYLSQSLYIQAALGNGADKIAAKHTVFLGKATLPKHCVVD